MQLTVLKSSEEIGEISQEIRRILRDKKSFNSEAFKDELADIFIYLIQARARARDFVTHWKFHLNPKEDTNSTRKC